MPNRNMPTVPIIPKHDFMKYIYASGHTILELGMDERIDRNEKTIRRWITKGEMPEFLLSRISTVIGVPIEQLKR